LTDLPASGQTQQIPWQFKKWLFNPWTYKNQFGITVGVVLALLYYIFVGYVPAAFIESRYTYGAIYVSLYSHVFRYPQFFGWITILLLIPPVLYLRSCTPLREKKNRLIVLATILFISVLALVIAFQSANIAPFGVKPEILESNPLLCNHFTKQMHTKEENNAYQEEILKLYKNRDNWSSARYLYYFAVSIQSFTMMFIFVVAAALWLYGDSPDSDNADKFKGALIYCSLTIMVAILWLLMRIAFIHQKPRYFPEISNPVGDYAAAGLFIFIVLLYVIQLFSWLFNKHSFILGLVSTSLGIFGALFLGSFKETLVTVFGRNAGLVPYSTILILICGGMVVIFVLVHVMEEDRRDKDPQSSSKPSLP